MLAFQLYVEGDNLGALNLFSRDVGGFDDRSVTVGEMFAAHAAVAYSAAQREAALERALVSRELVGQAQGILMGAPPAEVRPGLRGAPALQPGPQRQARRGRPQARRDRRPAGRGLRSRT